MTAFRARLVLCLASSLVAAAHAMTDPTRPPATVTVDVQEPMRTAPPVLQSVIIGRTGRAAIIDGERVEIGGTYRDAKVVRITEDEVVLRQGELTQVLKMYPDVERKAMKLRDSTQARPSAARSRPP